MKSKITAVVRPVFLAKKIQFDFLFICLCDKIDGRDERDLFDGSEDGRGGAVTGIYSCSWLSMKKKRLQTQFHSWHIFCYNSFGL